MSNSQFHDAFVTLPSERWRQPSCAGNFPGEIDRDCRFMVFASVQVDMTGRGNPPRPLRDFIEGIKPTGIEATGRGGPSPRPLHRAQSFATYGKLAMQRDDHAAGVG